MENPQKIEISQQVLEKIKTRRVKMTPKLIFTFKKLGQKGVLAIILIFSVIILSLMVYLIQQQSSVQFLSLGSSVRSDFFSELPYSWLLLTAFFVAIATYIFRKYSLAYRQPFYRSLITMTAIVILVGGLLSFSNLHQGMAAKAAEFDLGLLKSVYRQALSCDFNSEHLLIGTVVGIDKENKTAEVITVGHLSITIKWFNDTKIINAPKLGEMFGAVGYQEGEVFYTQGIRKVELSALKNRCFNENKDLNLQ